MGLILLSIYLSDYSIASFRVFIQKFLLFCIKNKDSRMLFSVGAAHTRPLE